MDSSNQLLVANFLVYSHRLLRRFDISRNSFFTPKEGEGGDDDGRVAKRSASISLVASSAYLARLLNLRKAVVRPQGSSYSTLQLLLKILLVLMVPALKYPNN